MINKTITAKELTNGHYSRNYAEKKELMDLRKLLDVQIADLEEKIEEAFLDLIEGHTEAKMRRLNMLNYRMSVLINRLKGDWLRADLKYLGSEVVIST